MKIIMFLIIIISFSKIIFCDVEVKELSREKINQIFNYKIKEKLGIDYYIFKSYFYEEKNKKYYIVLTEEEIPRKSKKTENKMLKAFNYEKNNENFTLIWTFKDYILKEETAIYFWTKYINLKDYDNDGLLDPVIIYGTRGINGIEDGRIKILTYYKNKKLAIRHQNSISDEGRKTKIDKTYYKLPKEIKRGIEKIMKEILGNNHAIFENIGGMWKMKLAEALILRADLQKRIEQIKNRLLKNAKVQEGDKVAEDPKELFAELNTAMSGFEDLLKRINKTNVLTKLDGEKSISDLIAERDNISKKRKIILAVAEAGIVQIDRYSRSEIKYISTVNISELQKKSDKLAKKYREIDTKIQQANWNVDLIEL